MDAAPNIAAFEAVRAENGVLRDQLRSAEARLAQYEHELANLKRLIFGTRSERFEPAGGPDQLPLFARSKPAAAGVPQRTEVRVSPRKKPVRQVLPSHLRREVVVIEPEVDTALLKKIGEEVTETLDYRPAKLVVIRRVRPKYVDPQIEDRGVVVAELPPRPVDKGMAEPGLLAHVVIEKYVDHMPLYRQVQRFTREGITLAESTLGGWTRATADLLVPLYETLKEEVLQSGYVQADETPIAVQDADKKGATHRGYYWVYHAPLKNLVVMDYQMGRGRDGPGEMLFSFEGVLQSDGYAVYDKYERHPGITLCGCWAHARRYFFEAQESSPHEAEHALKEIALLYDVERALRETDPSPDNRLTVRRNEALPILQRLETWLKSLNPLPKSPLGKAVTYALLRWEKLSRYAENGCIEIDNNLVENAIRPIALGRKNYLFAGSHEAAQRAAVIYSLLATCKKHDVNPHSWLNDVLARIVTHPQKRVQELLPHHWKERKG